MQTPLSKSTIANSLARPRWREFLSADWRYLVMLNYEVSRALIEPLLPIGTELDLFNGRILITVVGFRFLRTRVLHVPVPLHRDFDEVNLRFYVRRVMPDGEVRRGVAFIREMVPRVAIAWLARLAYNEPYRALPMQSTAPAGITETPGRIAYRWMLPAAQSKNQSQNPSSDPASDSPQPQTWQEVSATAVGSPELPAADSEATFIAEHYWGYTRQRDAATVEYRVSHPPWRIWQAEDPQLRCDVAKTFGSEFAQPLAAAPTSAFIAEGSHVIVHHPTRLVAAAAMPNRTVD